MYIPENLRVGFVNRKDTFDGKLGYVIYYRGKKIQKERSFESWRDKKIDTLEHQNVPTSGFVLNKGHSRYGYSSFSGKRSVIRIYDPRGWEFEIEGENLVKALMYCDCIKREMQGEMVYAFDAGKTLLLPVNSEEYKKTVERTEFIAKKVYAKDLKEGFLYKSKEEKTLMYLGKHEFVNYTSDYWYIDTLYLKSAFVFYDTDAKKFTFVKSIPQSIKECLSLDRKSVV